MILKKLKRLKALHYHLEDVNIQKEIANEAQRLEIKTKAPLLLCELLFDQNILSQIKKYRMLILRFTLNDKKAQRYLMGGIEQVVSLHKDDLMAKVLIILKVLYDSDILSEAAIIEWKDKISKKYNSEELSQEMYDKAAPFIKWLKEAEEEELDSEDSECDVEIEYNDRAEISPFKQKVQEVPIKKIQDEEDVADVDIDAI